MDDELHRIRRQMSEAFTEEQVAVLRSIRDDLSSRRWQVMLEIDAAQEDLLALQRSAKDTEWSRRLEAVQVRLKRAHAQLARFPEDVIPAF